MKYWGGRLGQNSFPNAIKGWGDLLEVIACIIFTILKQGQKIFPTEVKREGLLDLIYYILFRHGYFCFLEPNFLHNCSPVPKICLTEMKDAKSYKNIFSKQSKWLAPSVLGLELWSNHI